MATPFAYVSLVTTGATSEGGARNFSYLRVLNTDILTGGGGGTTITSVISSLVTSLISASVTNYTFQNANNVSFGTAGSIVTASASYTWAHVAPARSSALAEMGMYAASVSPSNPCQYSEWVAGSNGYWAWIQLP